MSFSDKIFKIKKNFLVLFQLNFLKLNWNNVLKSKFATALKILIVSIKRSESFVY